MHADTHPPVTLSPPVLPAPPLVCAETAPLLDLIRRGQERDGFFPPAAGKGHSPTPVILGVSGGADSLCLLHLLLALAPEFSLALHVAHLDHGLRPESGEDARFVADLAQAWGAPCHVQRLAPGHLAQAGGNLEAAARAARYAFLGHVARQIPAATPEHAPIIALAHHADDQAETLLLHLLRGSGLDGLAAMRPVAWRTFPAEPGGEPTTFRVVRPLLEARRSQILDHLHAHGLTWREDATNQDPTFLRNRLRCQVLPLLHEISPHLAATLGRTARILAAEADRLARLDQETLAGLLLAPAHPQRLLLDWERTAHLDPATRRGVLRMALARLLAAAAPGTDAQISFELVAELAAQVRGPAQAGGPFPLIAGLAWSALPAPPARLSLHRADCLAVEPDHPWLDPVISPDPLAIPLPGQIQAGHWRLIVRLCPRAELPPRWSDLSPWEVYLDGDALGAPTLARPRMGQSFAPLGLDGKRKSLGNLFTDRKIPPGLRAGWPLILAQDGRVAWVCGVQMGHPWRITPQSRQILHLAWQRLTPAEGATP